MQTAGNRQLAGTARWWTPADAIAVGTLALLAGLVFGQTLAFDFVPYDDPAMVTGNGYVRHGFSFDGLRWALFHTDSGRELAHAGTTNLWHPLTWLSHMLDATLFGVSGAGGQHAVSALLHLLSGLLVYAIGRRLGLHPGGAWVAAALFLVHPLHVEPVAWVSARKHILGGAMLHAALLLGLTGRMRWATAMFTASLLANPPSVVGPLLMLLLWLWPPQGRLPSPAWWLAQLRILMPWLAAAALCAAIALYVQGTGSHAPFMDGLPLHIRLLGLASGFLFLLQRSVWPVDLAFHYPWPQPALATHLGAWAILMAGAVSLFLLRKRFPGLLWAFLWFTVCWLPASGIAYVGTSFTADRYAYLGLTGFFLVFGRALTGSGPAREALSRWRRGLAAAAALVIATATGLAWKQTGVWRDGWTLFEHAVRVQPKDPMARTNLAGMLQQDQRHAEALDHYRQALAFGGSRHLIWFNKGNSLRELDRLPEAEQAFRRAVDLAPGLGVAWINLGLLLGNPDHPGHDRQAAREAFASSWQASQGRDPVALLLLVESHLALGERAEAEALLPRLRELAPRDPRVQERLRQWELIAPR